MIPKLWKPQLLIRVCSIRKQKPSLREAITMTKQFYGQAGASPRPLQAPQVPLVLVKLVRNAFDPPTRLISHRDNLSKAPSDLTFWNHFRGLATPFREFASQTFLDSFRSHVLPAPSEYPLSRPDHFVSILLKHMFWVSTRRSSTGAARGFDSISRAIGSKRPPAIALTTWLSVSSRF